MTPRPEDREQTRELLAEPTDRDIIAAKSILFGAVMDDSEHSELQLSFLRQVVTAMASALARERANSAAMKVVEAAIEWVGTSPPVTPENVLLFSALLSGGFVDNKGKRTGAGP